MFARRPGGLGFFLRDGFILSFLIPVPADNGKIEILNRFVRYSLQSFIACFEIEKATFTERWQLPNSELFNAKSVRDDAVQR